MISKLQKMRLFSPQYTSKLHFVELLLVVVIMALSAARLFLSGRKNRTRASSMGLGMVRIWCLRHYLCLTIESDPKNTIQGAKSLVFLLYQLLSTHVTYFRRWASLKAYFIINALEIVFWSAVVFLVMQANLKLCVGTSCALGWVVVVLAGFMRYNEQKTTRAYAARSSKMTH